MGKNKSESNQDCTSEPTEHWHVYWPSGLAKLMIAPCAPLELESVRCKRIKLWQQRQNYSTESRIRRAREIVLHVRNLFYLAWEAFEQSDVQVFLQRIVSRMYLFTDRGAWSRNTPLPKSPEYLCVSGASVLGLVQTSFLFS